MTQILLVCSQDGAFKRVTASGHAGFAKKGKDIVCAAETSLLRTAMQVLEQTEGVLVKSDASERGFLSFSAEASGSRERLVCVADFIRTGIKSISCEFPELVKLEELTE